MNSPRFLFPLTVSALFIGVFLYRVDVQEMSRALKTANYAYVLPGLLLYLVAMGWRSLRWRTILQPLGRFPLGIIWRGILVGYAANNLLPVRLGELVRAYWFGQRERLSKTSVLATILVERLLDGLALMFLVVVAALFLPVLDLLRDLGAQAHINWLLLVVGLSLPFFTVGASMAAAVLWPHRTSLLMVRLFKPLPAGSRATATGIATRFIAGLLVMRDPTRLVRLFLLSLPIWLSEAGLYYTIALGFGMDTLFDGWLMLAGVLVVSTATSNLGTAIPSTGAGVGPFEFFGQATLLFFGVEMALASAYIVVVHAALVIPVTTLGLVYLTVGNLSLRRLAAASQEPDRVGEQ